MSQRNPSTFRPKALAEATAWLHLVSDNYHKFMEFEVPAPHECIERWDIHAEGSTAVVVRRCVRPDMWIVQRHDLDSTLASLPTKHYTCASMRARVTAMVRDGQ